MGKPSKKSIAISGTTGFVGKNLIRLLNHNDVEYAILSRTTFQRTRLPKLSKCFCFVHLVGTGIENVEKSFQEVNVELTKKAIDICKKSKIKKIIYFSGLGVSKNSTSRYFISKFKAEQIIINSGLNYTIFRPSYIIGKDDYLTKNIQKQIRKNKIVIPGSGKYTIQPISINDVCKIVYIAIKSKKFSKKILDLVGPEKISFKQFIINSIPKSSIKIKKISLAEAYVKALTDSKFAYGIEDLNILLGDFQGNHEKLRKMSGIKFLKIRNI